MSADDSARNTARRLVLETLAEAGLSPEVIRPQPSATVPETTGVTSPAPPTEAERIAQSLVADVLRERLAPPGSEPPSTEAQRIAHRVMLDTLQHEQDTGGPMAASAPRDPPPGARTASLPRPSARPDPSPRSAPLSRSPGRTTPVPTVASISLASAETARRIVADAVGEHAGVQPDTAAAPEQVPSRSASPGPPPPPPAARRIARRIVAETLDEHADVIGTDAVGDELVGASAPIGQVPDRPAGEPPIADHPRVGVDLLPSIRPDDASAAAPTADDAAPGPSPPAPAEGGQPDAPVREPLLEPRPTVVPRLTPMARWRARRHRKRLASQWAPGATPQPRRTWRWVLATVIVALALGVLFPLTIAAFRALVAL